MSMDTKTVARIAHLARLKVPEEEIQSVANELGQILAFVAQLDEVDVEGIEPLASVNDTALRTRDDVVNDGGIQQEILSNAPEQTAGFFVVPKVIE